MRDTTIARNYAEALIELARRAGGAAGGEGEAATLERWGTFLDEIAGSVEADGALRTFLASPRASASQKSAVIGKAFDGQLPRTFIRFLQALVTRRRQMLIPEVAREYRDLVDEASGRIHAAVTVARPADEVERSAIASRLSQSFGKEVIAHYAVNPAILGGVIVRVGDTVLDGSVRRRLGTVKARMLAGR